MSQFEDSPSDLLSCHTIQHSLPGILGWPLHSPSRDHIGGLCKADWDGTVDSGAPTQLLRCPFTLSFIRSPCPFDPCILVLVIKTNWRIPRSAAVRTPAMSEYIVPYRSPRRAERRGPHFITEDYIPIKVCVGIKAAPIVHTLYHRNF